jgi:hypothetical protein
MPKASGCSAAQLFSSSELFSNGEIKKWLGEDDTEAPVDNWEIGDEVGRPRRYRRAVTAFGGVMTNSTRSSGTFFDRYFGLTQHGTSLRTEFIAGVTTFLTMVYIIFVNPQILSAAGMDKGAVFVATCIAAAVGTLIMGLYANYPIALAPGMGLNAFFAFTVVLTYKYTWQQALAAVFCSGVLFLLISVLPVREHTSTLFRRT